jgi:hypothetical protein
MSDNEMNGLRPVIVDGKQRGFFHLWEQKSQPVAAGIAVGSAPAGQLSYVLGIVEMEDGSVIECFPYKIHFLDRASVKAERTVSKKSMAKPRWAPESEIEAACMWITKTVKSSMWPCGADGEKACDNLCKQCWEKWKSKNEEQAGDPDA